MPERPNGAVLKTAEVQASVGSNPTPSACTRQWTDLNERTGPMKKLLILIVVLIGLGVIGALVARRLAED